MPATPGTCPRCEGSRIVQGTLADGNPLPTFVISERRRGFWHAISPGWFFVDRQSCWICLECGLFWSSIDNPALVLRWIRKHGTEALVGRLFPEKVKVLADPLDC